VGDVNSEIGLSLFDPFHRAHGPNLKGQCFVSFISKRSVCGEEMLALQQQIEIINPIGN